MSTTNKSSENINAAVVTENTNNPEVFAVEVMKCITQMKEQEIRLCREIRDADVEKNKLQLEIRYLTDKLAKIMYHIAQKIETLEDLKKSLKDTEDSYAKLVENSHLLYKTAKKSKKQFVGQVAVGKQVNDDKESESNVVKASHSTTKA